MREELKINFCDFWPDFQKDNNYFYHLLSQEYVVKIDEEDPDLLFFSVDYARKMERDKYKGHRCKKIFYTGESVPANFDSDRSIEMSNHQAFYSIGKCDFAFTFDFSNDLRHYRLPLWALQIDWFKKGGYGNPQMLMPPSEIKDNRFIRTPKTRFCAFVFSNPVPMRVEAYNKFSEYKQVHGYGKPFNNWFYGELGKYEILQHYKFSICFENRIRSGYYTEKPFHAKTAGTVPIYFSDKGVSYDMNEKAFINYFDFDTMDNLLEYVKKVDQDDNLFREYQRQPLFKRNKIKYEFSPDAVLGFFKKRVLV